MIKFFTILFLAYYIMRLFKPSMYVNTFNSFSKMTKELNEITDEKAKGKFIIDNVECVLKAIALIFIILLPLAVAEFIYILSAVQYGDKLITVGFIVWWFLILLIGSVKSKIQKANGELYKETKKFSLWRTFITIIDVLYFGYMYFVLFIR